MSTLNIGGDKSDASYRYKMPALVTKIEGRGNGIKTVILNMAEIAKSLHIHAAYPTKYFGIELGAQSKFMASSDRAIVNGAHQPGDLAKILERFISQFILCPVCKLPELKMSVKSSIKIDCAACGHNSTMKTSHKLAQYIIKNPPKQLLEEEKAEAKNKKKVKPGSTVASNTAIDGIDSLSLQDGTEEKKDTTKKKGGKREHKKDKKKKAAENADDVAEDGDSNNNEDTNGIGVDDDEDDDSDEPIEKAKPKKISKSKPSKSSGSTTSSTKPPTNSDDVWYTDTSEEAQKARKDAEFREARDHQAQAQVEAILASSKQDNKQEAPSTTLKIFLASKANRSKAEINAELKRITLAKGLDQVGKMRVLLDAILDLQSTTSDNIPTPQLSKQVGATLHKYASLFESFTTDRATTLQFICVIEEYIGTPSTNAANSPSGVAIAGGTSGTGRSLVFLMPHMLKQLYEDDVLEEEAIIDWHRSPVESSWLVKPEVAELVRNKAKVFVEWLETADEDGDEDGEEDGEDEGDEDEDES